MGARGALNAERPPIDVVALIAPELCRAIVDAARADVAWRDATVNERGDHEVRDTVRSALFVRDAEFPPSIASLAAEVCGAAEALACARDANLRAGQMQLVRYPPGGFFRTHQDARFDPPEWRKLSIVAYLNDDFEGGETVFPAHLVTVRPRTGMAAIFPSYFFHHAEAVTAGEKFILAFWLGEGEPPPA